VPQLALEPGLLPLAAHRQHIGDRAQHHGTVLVGTPQVVLGDPFFPVAHRRAQPVLPARLAGEDHLEPVHPGGAHRQPGAIDAREFCRGGGQPGLLRVVETAQVVAKAVFHALEGIVAVLGVVARQVLGLVLGLAFAKLGDEGLDLAFCQRPGEADERLQGLVTKPVPGQLEFLDEPGDVGQGRFPVREALRLPDQGRVAGQFLAPVPGQHRVEQGLEAVLLVPVEGHVALDVPGNEKVEAVVEENAGAAGREQQCRKQQHRDAKQPQG